MASREQLVLSFHGLGPVPDGIPADEAQYWCDVEPFEAILDLIGPVQEASGVPIVITFDDGNMSDAELALPRLVDRGMDARFFVCAGRIGSPGYLDEPAIGELVDAGMVVGSHGWSHVDWRRCDDETLDHEVRGARTRLQDVTGVSADQVAIPFGSYDRRTISRLRREGLRTVYTSDRGRAPADAWLQTRETYDTTWGPDTLRMLATQPVSAADRFKGSLVGAVKRFR